MKTVLAIIILCLVATASSSLLEDRLQNIENQLLSKVTELDGLKKDRAKDRKEIKKLQSQLESQRNELTEAVVKIDDLNRKIEEMKSNCCANAVSTTTTRSTTPGHVGEFIDIGQSSANIAVFNDLKLVAAGSTEVRIYDMSTRQHIRTINNRSSCYATFKHNQLIVAPGQGLVNIWNVESGELVKSFGGHFRDSLIDIALNKNQTLMVSGGDDRRVRLWDMIDFKEIRTLTGHTDLVQRVAIYEAHGQVISSSRDRSMRVWNMNDGSLVKTLIGSQNTITKLLIDEQTGRLYSASIDRSIQEWNIETGTVLKTFVGHTDKVYDLIFDQEGHRLISCSFDKSIIVWDKDTGKRISQAKHTSGLIQLALDPLNGQILSTTVDNKLIFWSIKY